MCEFIFRKFEKNQRKFEKNQRMSGELPLVPNVSTIRTATDEESGGRRWIVRKSLIFLNLNYT